MYFTMFVFYALLSDIKYNFRSYREKTIGLGVTELLTHEKIKKPI